MRKYLLSIGTFVMAAAAVLPATKVVAAAGPVHAAPATHPVVRIENFTFSPPTLQVRAGTTVTWTNTDDTPHSVVAKNGGFRSKVLDTGDSFSFTFASKGEFAYFCGLHPHMVGKIIVTG